MKFKNHNRYKADDATMNTTRKPKRKGKHNAYYQNPYTRMGIGKVVSGFLVDKDHENGLEEHYITTTGLVVIRNHNTHKAITVLVARPAQIDRYYYNVSDTVMPVVAAIKKIAKYNCEVCHYNY